MSQSTDAIFFFGLCFSDEDGPDFMWEHHIIEGGEFDGVCAGCDAQREEIEVQDDLCDWHGNFERFHRRYGSTHGLEFGIHCTDSAPMLYVAISETLEAARRGFPVQILVHTDVAMPDLDKDEVKRRNGLLRKFCEEEDLDFDGLGDNLGWWLCSYWEA